MNSLPAVIQDLLKQMEDHAKTSVELYRLRALEKATVVAVSLFSRIGTAVAVCLFLIVFLIGTSFLLGDLLGKTYYGFFGVAFFLLFITILFHYRLSRWIRKPLSNHIIKTINS